MEIRLGKNEGYLAVVFRKNEMVSISYAGVVQFHTQIEWEVIVTES